MRKLLLLILSATATLNFGPTSKNDVRINQVQVIGSHNSYKKAIDSNVHSYVTKDLKRDVKGIEYEHGSLEEQLDLGIRGLELDIYADTKGGRFANPKIVSLVKASSAYDPKKKMLTRGFKLIHMPEIDFFSTYYPLEDALKALRGWSAKNPTHSLVFITIEPKEGKGTELSPAAESFTTEVFELLEKEIITNLGRDRIVTPDDLRGDYCSLNQAVMKGNWPTVKEARGKFLFILDKVGKTRDIYIGDTKSLKGKLLFTNSPAGSPESATLILNESDDPFIPQRVKEGYIVRTRADANTVEAKTNDYTKFNNAKKSGAHLISTDYYLPSKLFASTFKVVFEDGSYERANIQSLKKRSKKELIFMRFSSYFQNKK